MIHSTHLSRSNRVSVFSRLAGHLRRLQVRDPTRKHMVCVFVTCRWNYNMGNKILSVIYKYILQLQKHPNTWSVVFRPKIISQTSSITSHFPNILVMYSLRKHNLQKQPQQTKFFFLSGTCWECINAMGLLRLAALRGTLPPCTAQIDQIIIHQRW